MYMYIQVTNPLADEEVIETADNALAALRRMSGGCKERKGNVHTRQRWRHYSERNLLKLSGSIDLYVCLKNIQRETRQLLLKKIS